MNICGINAPVPFLRVRFYFIPEFSCGYFPISEHRRIEQYFLALAIRKDSPYELKNEHIELNGVIIGYVKQFINDTVEIIYPRRKGTVITFNPYIKSKCSGCDFCYMPLLTPNDFKVIKNEEFLNRGISPGTFNDHIKRMRKSNYMSSENLEKWKQGQT